jgi:WD40 repeat protein
VKLWDAGSGKVLQTLKGHESCVNGVAFSRDGKTLASASRDKTVKLWDAGSGKVLQTLKGHESCVNGVAFSRDGKTLASASDDRMVKLWDTGSGKALQTLKGDSNNSLNSVLNRSASSRLLSVENDWIFWKGKKVLWLPSEYRSDILAVHDSAVGFGYSSGQVLVLKFVTYPNTNFLPTGARDQGHHF